MRRWRWPNAASSLHQSLGSGHGLAVALATLGQIYVQLGDLERAEQILTRTLEVRSPVQFHETTGAVFDTLAQIHLMRGSYERAGEYLRQASDAYGAYGTQTMRWYEWSLKVLGVKLAIRRGAYDEALAMADELAHAPGVPPSDAIQADLAACEALVAGRAHRRRRAAPAHLRGHGSIREATPANWGEFLRIRGLIHEQTARPSAAYHDFAQSANVFELLGERYQAALSQLSLGRLSAEAGSRRRRRAEPRSRASRVFKTLGAQRDLDEAAARAHRARRAAPQQAGSRVPGRRRRSHRPAAGRRGDLPRAAGARNRDGAHRNARGRLPWSCSSRRRRRSARAAASPAATPRRPRAIARAATQGTREHRGHLLHLESLGRDHDGPRFCARHRRRAARATRTCAGSACSPPSRARASSCAARASARRRSPSRSGERSLEPLLPGFICASAAMNRLADQIQRLQGHNLTVLITGESGTGKDLVARAIHAGSPRSAAMFLPYNCTTTTRELADSQLFGHRRGSFTGAVTDQQGLIRSAAGGTLFLDEIGDLPLDIQPKLLRFLEQGEIMPVGETRPQAVDVRVLAATNADLEQRVSEGKFREDLYYRLSVIRIHVPPLRERREEIPHLSTFFLRDACERLGKPDVHLSSATLDLFARYWWPGNVRQLRNEIQRAVAMSPPGGTIEPEHLSADLTAPGAGSSGRQTGRRRRRRANQARQSGRRRRADRAGPDHGDAGQHRGNISETARVLGLTRRGLYLKMRRLGLEATLADTQ